MKIIIVSLTLADDTCDRACRPSFDEYNYNISMTNENVFSYICRYNNWIIELQETVVCSSVS